MNKRGLSVVVVTLILILLGIVVVGILWVVISGIVSEGARGITLGRFLVDLRIENAYISSDNVMVTLSRGNDDAQLTKIQFIVSDGLSSRSIEKSEDTFVLGRRGRTTFTLTQTDLTGVGFSAAQVVEVAVAPIFIEEGRIEETQGDITDRRTIGTGGAPVGGSPSPPSPPAQECTNEGSCDCEDCEAEYGGDIPCCLNGECVECIENENCAGDDVCSNNVCVEPECVDNEDCLNVEKCDNNVCVALCNGTWEQEHYDETHYQCDGIGVHGCTSCECDTGFTPDELGGCDLNPPISSGIISSVWLSPGSARIFSSDDLPKDQGDLIGWTQYYVNFTGSAETRCFRISIPLYNPEVNETEITLNLAGGEDANINPTEQYNVWEAENCGQE